MTDMDNRIEEATRKFMVDGMRPPSEYNTVHRLISTGVKIALEVQLEKQIRLD